VVKNLCGEIFALIFAVLSAEISLIREREFSSAGSEHLPYKQRVGGSNPSTPTGGLREIEGFFVLGWTWRLPILLE
jgi:hypothetical protein